MSFSAIQPHKQVLFHAIDRELYLLEYTTVVIESDLEKKSSHYRPGKPSLTSPFHWLEMKICLLVDCRGVDKGGFGNATPPKRVSPNPILVKSQSQ